MPVWDDDPPHAPEFESYDDQLYSTLSAYEEQWRDRQPFLQSMGYMLRPRYRPGWVPSWRGKGGLVEPMYCEDGLSLPLRKHLTDATRISDGALVYIKRVMTGDRESQIAIMLSSDDLRADPRNHSVPILHAFEDADDPRISYIVMPFFRLFDDPPFKHVGEVVDLVDQLLEGLVFLHEHGVAHRDCTNKNLMMDASSLYPQGFHPVNDTCLPDARTTAIPLPRSSANVKYYFVDYGISSYFHPDQRREFVVGDDGRDRDVPELSSTVPYDPFKVDIFILGNLFRREFHSKYSNVTFLAPLIAAMTQTDPASRPDAEEVLRVWTRQRRRVSALHGRWPLKRRTMPIINSLFIDISILYDAFTSYVTGLVFWATGR